MEVFVPLFPLAIYALSVIQNDFLLLIFHQDEGSHSTEIALKIKRILSLGASHHWPSLLIERSSGIRVRYRVFSALSSFSLTLCVKNCASQAIMRHVST